MNVLDDQLKGQVLKLIEFTENGCGIVFENGSAITVWSETEVSLFMGRERPKVTRVEYSNEHTTIHFVDGQIVLSQEPPAPSPEAWMYCGADGTTVVENGN
ncbi:hypothetical protein IE4872_CH01621 [Rhizobium gallicum]|uniref:Uncharacterized protein n=1 Tax=Rhizobium gallicum TaxID=56730 RepID=A0A1L5NH64_9HYPH|nr:hypothetical protein [Rhizobium gallicum]APO67263.1 hypothetical protein IE4872_CH01621 [Rhizobium gallicum]